MPHSVSKRCRASGVVDALVVRIEHRDQAGVGGALHVVLAAQRMQARCRACRSGRSTAPARSGSARCRCRERAARCPCPTGSSSPSTSRTAARPRGSSAASMPQIGAIASGRERLHVLGERLVAGRAIADERLVDEALLDDDVHHRVQQRDVGVGLELQVVGRVAREVAAARVGDDQLRAALWRRSSSRSRPPDD